MMLARSNDACKIKWEAFRFRFGEFTGPERDGQNLAISVFSVKSRTKIEKQNLNPETKSEENWTECEFPVAKI
jgi:hypothetical protein